MSIGIGKAAVLHRISQLKTAALYRLFEIADHHCKWHITLFVVPIKW